MVQVDPVPEEISDRMVRQRAVALADAVGPARRDRALDSLEMPPPEDEADVVVDRAVVAEGVARQRRLFRHGMCVRFRWARAWIICRFSLQS